MNDLVVIDALDFPRSIGAARAVQNLTCPSCHKKANMGSGWVGGILYSRFKCHHCGFDKSFKKDCKYYDPGSARWQQEEFERRSLLKLIELPNTSVEMEKLEAPEEPIDGEVVHQKVEWLPGYSVLVPWDDKECTRLVNEKGETVKKLDPEGYLSITIPAPVIEPKTIEVEKSDLKPDWGALARISKANPVSEKSSVTLNGTTQEIANPNTKISDTPFTWMTSFTPRPPRSIVQRVLDYLKGFLRA